MVGDEKLAPLSYVLVVTAVILRKKSEDGFEALILKRSAEEKEGPGLWTIPGGKVEEKDWGTTYQGISVRAIKREVKEETGITMVNFFLMPQKDCIYIRDKGKGKPTYIIRFWGLCPYDTQVKQSKESVAHVWASDTELDAYEFIGNVKGDILIA